MENKLKKELPEHIFNKIIFNKHTYGLPSSSFSSNIKNNDEMLKLDEIFNNGCVKQISLYELSIPKIVDGWKVRVIKKGTNIYKSFQSFLTENDIIKYNEKNLDNPSWFGNKYLVYAITKTDWNSIISFKLIKDLVLIDYFDEYNLNKLIKLINNKNIIKILKIASGFKTSLSNQIKYLHEIYKWQNLWVYTKPVYPNNTYLYCDSRRKQGFNPIAAIKQIHSNDIQLFYLVLSKFPKIDGIIREQIQSSIDESGIFYHEELLIKGMSQIEKIKFDYNDPLCWVNWDIKGLKIPETGFNISYMVNKFANNSMPSPNYNFKLIKFVLNNNYDNSSQIKFNKTDKIIFSYNLHNFINLDINIKYKKNMDKILEMIEDFNNNIELLCFQELIFNNNLDKLYFENKLENLGYIDSMYVKNGDNTQKNTFINLPLIGCFTKYKTISTKFKYIIDESEFKNYILNNNNVINSPFLDSYNKYISIINQRQINENREQILIKTKSFGLLCIVHLPICIREIENIEIKKIIKNVNSNYRILVLTKILSNNPDVVIGDFNFTLDDIETEFMLSKGYMLTNGINNKQLSTPHNRVDLCFTKKKLGKNYLIKTNYSDHLPMIQLN